MNKPAAAAKHGDHRLPFEISRRAATLAAAVPLAFMLLANLIGLIDYGRIALGYPFELDYGEGIVWQQMRDIVAGHGYAPLGVYPAIVYHYPPVYHLTSAFTAMLFGLDQLAAGRTVSLLSTGMSAVLAGSLCAAMLGDRAERPVRYGCGILAALILLSCRPIIIWALLMRVDMLCAALLLAGLVLTVGGLRRPFLVVGAGIAFTLAIFTKQTSIAAPIAAFVALALVAPRQAVMLLATCLAIGLLILAVLIISTDGEFFRHILLYNVNRFDPARGPFLLGRLMEHIGFIFAGTAGAVAVCKGLRTEALAGHGFRQWRGRIGQSKANFAALVLLLHLLITTLMIPLILKSGSNVNYLIEWLCALSIFAGIGARPIFAYMLGSGGKAPVLLTALYLAGVPATIWGTSRFPGDGFEAEVAQQAARLQTIVGLVRQSPKPVIGDDMTLLLRAGRPVQWEPAITAELGSAGLYDDHAFARMVRRGAFGFFITRGLRGMSLYDDRYNPVVADAMDAAYPRKVIFAGEVLHLPKDYPDSALPGNR